MFVVKVPGINGNSDTSGCEKSGNEILKILKKEGCVNESGNVVDITNLDLEEIHLDNSNLKLTNHLIYKNSFEIFESKPKTIFLGGDHSISYSLCKAFLDSSKKRGKEPCLILFDAHPDCKPFLSPSQDFPKNEEWLRKLIEDGFPKKNILIVGIRNMSKEEFKFLKDNSIKTLSLNSLLEDIEETCEIIMEFSDKKDLYLSVDIDVIDPLFAPATANPEIGGLTSREFIYLISRLNKIKNLRAVDLVEVNPLKDKEHLTLTLGAKIISELI